MKTYIHRTLQVILTKEDLLNRLFPSLVGQEIKTRMERATGQADEGSLLFIFDGIKEEQIKKIQEVFPGSSETEVPTEIADKRILERRIQDIDSLSVRVKNRLLNKLHLGEDKYLQIVTVADLISLRKQQLWRIHDFGKKSIEEVVKFVGAHGLKFQGEE